jgi:hypothetical protein
MFGLFKKSDSPVVTDKVWRTRVASNKGIVAAALQAWKDGKVPVILFFFEESRQRIEKFLGENKVSFQLIERGRIYTVSGEPVVFLADATKDLTGEISRLGVAGSQTVLFYGHYPLTAPENEVLENLKPAVGVGPYVFFQSLEDGLMQHFGSDKIASMMQQLGMPEDESVQHSMISKALLNARKNLDQKVSNEMKSRSEEQWFANNCP